MKRRHIRLGLTIFASAILIAAVSNPAGAQMQTCPAGQPVCHNIPPMGGHSTAANLASKFECNCPNDGRRVITVFMDWGNPTNARIYNAVQCAINKWNSATDGANPPNHTAYYLQVDQSHEIWPTPNITIVNEQPGTSPFAESFQVPNGWKMRLGPNNATLNAGLHPDEDLCGRVAHELGHILGLNGLSVDCFSIMHGSKTDGSRDQNVVTPNDVFQVNRNLDDTTRTNGYCKPPKNLSDDPDEEGGDPCGGDPCCGDPSCSDPCAGDPYCGDPCAGDPYCGDPCAGDPCCGQGQVQVCNSFCYAPCNEVDECGNCISTGPMECEDYDCHMECW